MTLGEEEIAFYFQVGNAITEWGLIEAILLRIVVACFENKGEDDVTHRALSLGFLSIEGFRAKMAFAEATVDRYLARHYPAERVNWAKLAKRAWAASSHRNKLAHWSVNHYPQSIPGRRFMLTPPTFKKPKKKSKRPLPPDGSQGLRDIVTIRLLFIALGMSLMNFASRLEGEKEQHPKAHEQPASPPPIAKLRDQILEGLVRLLQPSEQKP